MKWCGGRGREGGKSVRWRGSRDGHYLHERRIDWPRSPSRTRKRSELLFLCLRLHLCAPRSWLIRSRSAYVMYLRINSVNAHRAALGIEPRTSRTLSENHTTRPSSQLTVRGCVFGARPCCEHALASERRRCRTRCVTAHISVRVLAWRRVLGEAT